MLLFIIALLPAAACLAGDKDKKASSSEIKWMTLDEVQTAMKKQPRKVYMDVYTDWCGWCKVMDRRTFSNPDVIKYMNDKFYAVKLNAEQRDSIRFMGKAYGFVEANRANQFAVEILRGQMSYPTSVILEENFQNPQAVPGFIDVPTMDVILHYLGENAYKNTPFNDYKNAYKATWVEAAPKEG